MKAISKGSLAGCLVHLDAGCTTCLAQQNFQILEHANNRTIPSWLFDARLSARDRLTSSCPDGNLAKNTNSPSLLICTAGDLAGSTPKTTQQRCTHCALRISLCRPDILLSILLTFKIIRRGLRTSRCLLATLLILTDRPFLFW